MGRTPARSVRGAREEPGPILCLLPKGVPYPEGPLSGFLLGRPRLSVIRERRASDRRGNLDRRSVVGEGAGEERRRISGRKGRRVGERRADLLPFRVPAVEAPGTASDLYRMVVFAQRVPRPPSELERLEAGWLVTDAQVGKPGAIERLYELYLDRVRRNVEWGLRDRDRVDDAVQEIFLRALRALPDFDVSTGHFGRWLSGIARNYLIDLARSRRQLDPLEPEQTAEDGGYIAPPTEQGASAFMELIETLPLSQRQVLFLRYVVDLSWTDVGLLLGRSSGAVRMLQLRAHETLRAGRSARVLDEAA